MEMHRCLDVVELVALICSELREQNALAALARTCKKLQGPALDRLPSVHIEQYSRLYAC
jgi:hypothetical protein